MPGRIVCSSDCLLVPWKNGLGVSSVVAAMPQAAGYDTLDWQVGTTGIGSSCPFSSLPGLDRQFLLLEGDGVELECRNAGGESKQRGRVDVPLEPFAFSGDWQTECRLLGGPVRVLNVVTRRARCSAQLSVATLRGPIELDKAADETLLLFVGSGRCAIEAFAGALAANDAFIDDGARRERYNVHGNGARVVVARIRAK